MKDQQITSPVFKVKGKSLQTNDATLACHRPCMDARRSTIGKTILWVELRPGVRKVLPINQIHESNHE